jgi:hypothetical protein
MDVAVRSDRTAPAETPFKYEHRKPHRTAGFFVKRRFVEAVPQSKRAGNFSPLGVSSYQLRKHTTSPMTVMPVAVMPTAVPVTMPTVMPVTVVVPMAVVVPAHFFRLDAIDLILRHDSGFSTGARRGRLQFGRYRRQRCRVRACGQHRAACHKSHREFQKVPAFHDFSPFLEMERGQTVSPSQDECSLNSSTVMSTDPLDGSQVGAEKFMSVGALQ